MGVIWICYFQLVRLFVFRWNSRADSRAVCPLGALYSFRSGHPYSSRSWGITRCRLMRSLLRASWGCISRKTPLLLGPTVCDCIDPILDIYSVPIFGYICDHFGPHKLSLIAGFFFGLGYFLASLSYSHELPYQVMVIAFTLVGMGTSSMYFAGLTTCAKNFTSSPGLALSLPIASIGLSSLWLSQFVSRVFVGENGMLMISPAFATLSVFLFGVGIVGGLCLEVFPAEDKEGGDQAGERERLLADDGGEGGFGWVDNVEEENKQWINAATRDFLKDKAMWWFAIGVFLVTGPGEAFINNMGSLIKSLYPPNTSSAHINPATHVSIIAVTSTIARISVGIISDYVGPSPAQLSRSFPRCSRVVLLIAVSCLLLTAHLLLTFMPLSFLTSYFWLISALVGSGYGAVFTLAPTIVSVVWGTENFGTNWGVVMTTPAVGATVYGLLYASVYDDHAGTDGRCWGGECYRGAFGVMAIGAVFAAGGWLWAWRGKGGWKERGVIV